MPKESLQKLRESIESAGELTPEHRERLRRVADDLESELHPVVDAETQDAEVDELREAIDLTGQMVKDKGAGDSEEFLTEFEEAVEKIAIKHPAIAGFLTALGRLV